MPSVRIVYAMTLLYLFVSSRASGNVHRQQATLVEEPPELPRPPEHRARRSTANTRTRRAATEPETRAYRRRRRSAGRQRRTDEGRRQEQPDEVPLDEVHRSEVPSATPSGTSAAGTGGADQGVVGLLSMPAVQHVLKFTAERVQQDPKWAAQLRAMQGMLSEPGGMQRMLSQLQRNAGSMAPGPPTLHKPPPAELIRPPAAPLLGGAAQGWPAGWMGGGKPGWTNAATPSTVAYGAAVPVAPAPGGGTMSPAASGGGSDPLSKWMSLHMGGAASLQLQHAGSAPQAPWMLPQGAFARGKVS